MGKKQEGWSSTYSADARKLVFLALVGEVYLFRMPKQMKCLPYKS